MRTSVKTETDILICGMCAEKVSVLYLEDSNKPVLLVCEDCIKMTEDLKYA